MSEVLYCCAPRGSCVELTQREYAVCNAICSSGGSLTFSQLKEISSFHQEILSRILRRLEVHGLIEKLPAGGYRRPGVLLNLRKSREIEETLGLRKTDQFSQ